MAPPAGQARHRRTAVAFVHEAAGDRARPGIDVLVVAPDREIGAAVVQRQRQVADRVGQVEADRRALGAGQARDRRQVEGLPGAVLDARPQHQRQAGAMEGDGAFDGGHRDRAVGLVRLHLDQLRGRVEAVQADL